MSCLYKGFELAGELASNLAMHTSLTFPKGFLMSTQGFPHEDTHEFPHEGTPGDSKAYRNPHEEPLGEFHFDFLGFPHEFPHEETLEEQLFLYTRLSS